MRKAKITYICDVCGEKPEWGIHASVNFDFGYTSKYDLTGAKWDFCKDCAEQLFSYIKLKYPTLQLEPSV